MCSFAILRLCSDQLSGISKTLIHLSLPPLHVRLDIEQILEPNSPWLSGGSFKHEASKLWMEDRRSSAGFPGTISMARFEARWSCLLCSASLHIRHSTPLPQQLLITGQSCKNVRLPEGEPNFMMLVIVAYD
jgi:hypothetical protein